MRSNTLISATALPRLNKLSIIILLAFIAVNVTSASPFPVPTISNLDPEGYVALFTDTTPVIDGNLDDQCWIDAEQTAAFGDITGEESLKPKLLTWAKMCWDSTNFYIAGYLEEPHVCGRLTQRDAVIFYDNDFEVFIDPDGDTHQYYELEINALNTVWDLLLLAPYRDNGTVIDSWDITNLQHSIAVQGTLNDPSDIDQSWTVELAIPWKVLEECAHRPSPPAEGDIWRINFSRVQWEVGIVDGKYQKEVDPSTGKTLPENNWTWSPQGLINMHYPEMWGMVEFRLENDSEPVAMPAEMKAGWTLRNIYYGQRILEKKGKPYTDKLKILNRIHSIPDKAVFKPELVLTRDGFDAWVEIDLGAGERKILQIDQTGCLKTID